MDRLGMVELDTLESCIMDWANSDEQIYHVYIEDAIRGGASWEETTYYIVESYLRQECSLPYEALQQMAKFIPAEMIEDMAIALQDYYTEEIEEWISTH